MRSASMRVPSIVKQNYTIWGEKDGFHAEAWLLCFCASLASLACSSSMRAQEWSPVFSFIASTDWSCVKAAPPRSVARVIPCACRSHESVRSHELNLVCCKYAHIHELGQFSVRRFGWCSGEGRATSRPCLHPNKRRINASGGVKPSHQPFPL